MCDYPECFESNIRKAKKVHKCCECKKDIIPGEKYEDFHGIWNGEANNYRSCIKCRNLRWGIQYIEDCDEMAFGQLYEYLESITSSYKKKVTDYWVAHYLYSAMDNN